MAGKEKQHDPLTEEQIKGWRERLGEWEQTELPMFIGYLLDEIEILRGTVCCNPTVAGCAKLWEADHQYRALEHYGLDEEFPYGCDAIDHVAEALLAARKKNERHLDKLIQAGRLLDDALVAHFPKEECDKHPLFEPWSDFNSALGEAILAIKNREPAETSE